MNNIICEVKWVEDDVRKAYLEHYGHNASDEEINEIISRIDLKGMESKMIEAGWDFIYQAL